MEVIVVVMAGNAVLLKVASNVGPEGALIAEHIAAAGPLIPADLFGHQVS